MEVSRQTNNIEETASSSSAVNLGESREVTRLVREMLADNIVEVRPQLDFTSELGFFYETAERILGVHGRAAVSVLESLVGKGVLKRDLFDKIIRCPQCSSINLRPTTHCSKCGSGNTVRGRVLEHFICKYVGIEDEFTTAGKYICPNCKLELRNIGRDYQSLGIMRKCRECNEVLSLPQLKWHCLKCSSVNGEDKVIETSVYCYTLNEANRSRLEFELKPKTQLIEFLRNRGYEIKENAKVKGRSGANHSIDILAIRDDGIITHSIAIGIEASGGKIELDQIFDFDDKVYDAGIHDKVLVVVPEVGKEAGEFARQQRIKVLEVRDLETATTVVGSPPDRVVEKELFEFKSRAQLKDYLVRHGYEVREDVSLKGRSGAVHHLDMMATSNDGIVVHNLGIGFGSAKEPVELDQIFAFDEKTYDIGIRDKIFIAIPELTPEARQFAHNQRIKTFEVGEVEGDF